MQQQPMCRIASLGFLRKLGVYPSLMRKFSRFMRNDASFSTGQVLGSLRLMRVLPVGLFS